MRRQGFTLTEILVVIAILGILAAVLTSSYAGALQRGRAANAQTHSRTVQISIQQWLSARPARSATVLNALNCMTGVTLNDTAAGYAAGFTDGVIGWAAASAGVESCTVTASGRTVSVQTTGGGRTFVNGVQQ